MSTHGQPAPSSGPSEAPSTTRRLMQGAGVIIVSSVMFSFIGYWRTAAVVLCDLASTAYYIGAIVEQSVGPSAPWFILAVMCFSYTVRWVYIESSALFVRGGVYRAVSEALGHTLAKIAVSALLFDYILTGPISSVSAGQYLIGLVVSTVNLAASPDNPILNPNSPTVKLLKNWGSVVIACAVTIYFFWQNLKGLHESSERAMQIMVLTTIMGAILIGWCLITLAVRGLPEGNSVPPLEPKIHPRLNYTVDPPEKMDPTGFLKYTGLAAALRGEERVKKDEQGNPIQAKDSEGNPVVDHAGEPAYEVEYEMSATWSWFSFIGLIGVALAFGHSILAMSGEETLAQVYREVESPKMENFKKAAFIVFLYSLIFTAGISFLAVMLIPDKERLPLYAGNLLGGLARNVVGYEWMRVLLEGIVVVVGFFILAGAVNTAIIGSNGVLNRVAEDGVMPDWFLKPHPRYGTTYRILYLILGLQLTTIILSQGDVFVLGEAYAFGVVWSFVFKALSMFMLRFTMPVEREFKVPGNIPIGGGKEIPVGLGLIFLVLLVAAIMNFLTKEYATIFGCIFTVAFFILFTVSERYNLHKLKGDQHKHVEQFNRETAQEVSTQGLGLARAYRKLIAIRSVQNLFMLEKALAETDPETTDLVVMTAKVVPPGSEANPSVMETGELDPYDQQLMTAVVEKAEHAGKEVKPLIVPTNNPLHAMLKTAKDIQANELVIGASNKYTADEQFEKIAFYWISLHDGNPPPLTVRVLSRERDMFLDLAGGSRIPKISERRARTVQELRAAGVGVDRVLLLHDGSPASSDLFQVVLTMLDEKVALGLVRTHGPNPEAINGQDALPKDEERARQIGRDLQVHELTAPDGPAIVEMAKKDLYDVIVLPLPAEAPHDPLGHLDERGQYIVRHAHCRVMLVTTPIIPMEVVDSTPSARP